MDNLQSNNKEVSRNKTDDHSDCHNDHHNHNHNDNDEHKHSHHHHHHHHHHTEMSGSKLLWVTLLNLAITIFQIIGGILSNSLSLLSDAIHNLGDSSAVFIAFVAGNRGRKQADYKKTFGYKRIEILAALFNAVVLISICIYLLFEAYKRFVSPEEIQGKMMFIVAIFGLLANLISVVILQKDKESNLNVKAAYLHLLGDTLSSVAVILGGLAIWLWNIYWLDPIITSLVSFYIIKHTWGVVREAVDILMQSAPDNISINDIKNEVEKIPEVQNIHHVHIWKLDDTRTFLEAHVNLKNDMLISEMMNVQQNIEQILEDIFHINHVTLQLGYNCCDGNDNLIWEKKN